jgi:hypothetical protein
VGALVEAASVETLVVMAEDSVKALGEDSAEVSTDEKN